jgi:FlaA1/EpsC-like NDP-sugar epimerase
MNRTPTPYSNLNSKFGLAYARVRVFITGGAGFIGSHLCDVLVARGDEVKYP